jgi:hypothetical protein
MARPSKYDPKFNEQARKLCLLGATDKELADFFEISESTLNEWKLKYDEFSESLKEGKTIADATVTESLYKSANGYMHEDTDIRVIDGQIVTTPIIKYYPPHPTSLIFWLKNRQSARWRDKTEQSQTMDITWNEERTKTD